MTDTRTAEFTATAPPPGREPERVGLSSGWRQAWFARATPERGWVRTYTARSVRRTTFYGMAVLDLVIDVVRHNRHGHHGPGSRWAATVTAGQECTCSARARRNSRGRHRDPQGHVYFTGYWRQGQAEP